MSEVTTYRPGTFSWVDLATPDLPLARRFYGRLFGWEGRDVPPTADPVRTVFRLRGRDVAAAYRPRRARPHWMPYVSVASADAAVERARELGASPVRGPFDVLRAGRMATLRDPGGAEFSVWEPREHPGAGLVGEPGTLCWAELATREPRAAQRFYTRLFGWVAETQEVGPTIYTSFLNDGRPNGGMVEMTPEWGEIEPHWMVYFAVEDCDASAERADRLGGSVAVPPTDLPGIGRFSVIRDPHGAVFSIIRLASDAA